MLMLSVTGTITTQLAAQEAALKTNLLYDATTTIHLGYEMALGRQTTLDIWGNYNPWTLGYKWVGIEGAGDQFTEQRARKLKHWMLQPELRWWECEKFNGHFFGVHIHGGQMNVGALSLPFGIGRYKDSKGTYYGQFPKEMQTDRGQKVSGVEYKQGSKDDYYKPLADVTSINEAKDQALYRNSDRDGVYVNSFEGWFIGAGVSYGYHWILTPRLSAEFTIGIGYAFIDYNKMRCTSCTQLLEKDVIHYFGPTRAGISLVYMIK